MITSVSHGECLDRLYKRTLEWAEARAAWRQRGGRTTVEPLVTVRQILLRSRP
ncbi:MAG TPA: hypothetical protein VFN97_01750 [Actinospica sp.]|nr:hypothetical protein [Actinospica sp.]